LATNLRPSVEKLFWKNSGDQVNRPTRFVLAVRRKPRFSRFESDQSALGIESDGKWHPVGVESPNVRQKRISKALQQIDEKEY
jgi:hypothetical protein